MAASGAMAKISVAARENSWRGNIGIAATNS